MVVAALIAGGLALALLVVIYWRTAKRYESLQAEVQRLRVVQKDMSSDVRVRIEEGQKAWSNVEEEVRPRLDRLEPSVADLSTSLEKSLPALHEARSGLEAARSGLEATRSAVDETRTDLQDARGRLEAIETRVAAAESDLRGALESGEMKASERAERIENAVRTLRNAADERLAELGSRLAEIERTVHPAKEEATPEEQASRDAEAGAQTSAPAPSLALAASGEATHDDERGTPADEPLEGGRWVVVLLVVVAGVALAISALA